MKKNEKGYGGGGGGGVICMLTYFWGLEYFQGGLSNFRGGLRNFWGIKKFFWGGVGLNKFGGFEKFSGEEG